MSETIRAIRVLPMSDGLPPALKKGEYCIDTTSFALLHACTPDGTRFAMLKGKFSEDRKRGLSINESAPSHAGSPSGVTENDWTIVRDEWVKET